ncbi:MAG: hypothetical protein FJZ01_13145 [Candidatus Sericytochromatia bacterium]|nr:hypothetical protein [Candidatus Tanganyikabacteria bacterium]
MGRRFKKVIDRGHGFVFKYDSTDPTILHNFARHLTTEQDAIDSFFDAEAIASRIWNDERQRFEQFSATHGLYWFWLDEGASDVMVISCFKLGGQA